MNPISAVKAAMLVCVGLTLGGCYYTSPDGYAPYYAPVPATLSQRETPVVPAAPGNSASTPDMTAGPPPIAAPAPVYVVPAYGPYPYYYPPYYPGWYDWGWPPVTLGFWGHWGGGGHWRGRGGGHWNHHPWGGGHGGGHRR